MDDPLLTIAWLLITRLMFRFKLGSIPAGAELIEGQIAELGPTSRGEKFVLAVFATATFFWIVPSVLINVGSPGEQQPSASA